ncbi:MAG: hypothetical protein ACYTEQ_12125 [Planctomycetota bacterium]|jgi:hypothetical protein
MVNLNTADPDLLYAALREGLLRAGVLAAEDANLIAAQTTVNVIDFRDGPDDPNDVVNYDPTDRVTIFTPPGGADFYGFERPCVYISELVYNHVDTGDTSGTSYAVELFKPYYEDDKPEVDKWQLVIDVDESHQKSWTVRVKWSGTKRFHVVKWEDPAAPLSVHWYDPEGPSPPDGAIEIYLNTNLGWQESNWANSYDVYLGNDFNDVNGADTSSTGIYLGNESSNSYGPGLLGASTTYYWRIDEVNEGGEVRLGSVWSFTTTADEDLLAPTEQLVTTGWSPGQRVFDVNGTVELQRLVYVDDDVRYVTVDLKQVPPSLPVPGQPGSCQRDIRLHKCIRRLWDGSRSTPTLGYANNYIDVNEVDDVNVQAHPANAAFTNVGEVGLVMRLPVYEYNGSGVLPVVGEVEANTEEEVRFNLAEPAFQEVLNYLTVFDPTQDGINNDGDWVGVDPCTSDPLPLTDEADLGASPELKVPGRININTAPWFVIAQLPWMQYYPGNPPPAEAPYGRARAICAWRDSVSVGFASTAQLMDVPEMASLMADNDDNVYNPVAGGGPDLTEDSARDDFEERDLIFSRISNLVTVRSDVFTAYILVRLGVNGPQKRVIAILDRSNVYRDGLGNLTGKVKLRALHPVPDPR